MENNSYWKDTAAILVSRILIALLQLVYVKIYTAHLSNTNLGIFALCCSLSYLLNAAVFVPVDYYQQARIYPLRAEGKSLLGLLKFNITILKWIAIASIAISIVVMQLNGAMVFYFLTAVLLAVTTYIAIALRGALNNLQHKITVALCQSIEAFSRILIFLILANLIGANALQMINAQILAFCISIALMLAYIWHMKLFSIGDADVVDKKSLTIFCYPIAIGALLNLVQLQGYRLILAPLGYLDVIGVYFGTTQVGIAGMSIVALTFSQVYLPKLYKTNGDFIPTYLRYAFFAIAFVFTFSLIFSRPLVMLLTKPEFAENSLLIIYGVTAEGANLLIGGFSVYMTIKNKTNELLWSSIIAGMVSVVATSILHLTGNITLYTIGLPIILSQAIVVAYLYRVYLKLI
jgi:O-antigen/teichoic acid export membrane protein